MKVVSCIVQRIQGYGGNCTQGTWCLEFFSCPVITIICYIFSSGMNCCCLSLSVSRMCVLSEKFRRILAWIQIRLDLLLDFLFCCVFVGFFSFGKETSAVEKVSKLLFISLCVWWGVGASAHRQPEEICPSVGQGRKRSLRTDCTLRLRHVMPCFWFVLWLWLNAQVASSSSPVVLPVDLACMRVFSMYVTVPARCVLCWEKL